MTGSLDPSEGPPEGPSEGPQTQGTLLDTAALAEAARRTEALEAGARALEALDPACPADREVLEGAMTRLRAYLATSPGEPAALALMGEFYLKADQPESAVIWLRRAVTAPDGDRQDQIRLLAALLATGDRAGAGAQALAWLRADPGQPGMWMHLAALGDGRTAAALLKALPRPGAKHLDKTTRKALDKAVAKSPDLAEAITRCEARLALAAGDEARAIALYRGLVQDRLTALLEAGGMQALLPRLKARDPAPFLQRAGESAVQDFRQLRRSPQHSPGRFWQAACESLRRQDWLGVIVAFAADPAISATDPALLKSLRLLAQQQIILSRNPMKEHPLGRENASLIKAYALLAPVIGHFWLDSGTLLGVTRAGKVHDWDTDIDLSIWHDAIPALAQICDELTELGYRNHMRDYRGRLYRATFKLPKTMPIHIHAFFRRGLMACSPQMMNLSGPQPAARLVPFARRPVMRPLLLALRGSARSKEATGPLRETFRARVTRPLWQSYLARRDALPRDDLPRRWPYDALHAQGTWVVETRHFERLEMLEVCGLPCPVPHDREGYLSLRYGDWRTPRSDWCYWMDDGSFRRQPPTECGFAELFP